jgi:hypothetical protein
MTIGRDYLGEDFPKWLLMLGELHLCVHIVVLSSETPFFVQSLVEEDCLIITVVYAWSLAAAHFALWMGGGVHKCLLSSHLWHHPDSREARTLAGHFPNVRMTVGALPMSA